MLADVPLPLALRVPGAAVKVRDLRAAIKGLDGDVEVIIVTETQTRIVNRSCYSIEVLDNGEQKHLALSDIDPNMSAAERSLRDFMRRR